MTKVEEIKQTVGTYELEIEVYFLNNGDYIIELGGTEDGGMSLEPEVHMVKNGNCKTKIQKLIKKFQKLYDECR